MRHLSFAAFIIIAVSLAGCSIKKQVAGHVSVRKVEPGTVLDDHSLYYCLPRTVFTIGITVDRKTTTPGPFAPYAERLLGVKEVPVASSVTHEIISVQVGSHPERDPDQVYLVGSSDTHHGPYLSLTADGIIRGVNIPISTELTVSQVSVADLREKVFDAPEYPDLTLRKNFEPIPDTVYRIVRTDTSFFRLPLIREVESQKTLLAQAEEAADVLMKIRTKRFALLNGDFNEMLELDPPVAFPEGGAYEVILRELAQMEQDYMSLFAGRTLTERETRMFTFTPAGRSLTEASTLCVFSRSGGIDVSESTAGEPVIIRISRLNMNPVDELQWSTGDQGHLAGQGLAYRIPELSRVEILRSGQKLFERDMLVAQSGRIDYIPAGLLSDDRTAIEFYPAYGSVKNIFSK